MPKNLETVGQIVDKLAKLPREMKLWVGVPKTGGGFDPCLVVRHISADPKGKPGRDDCGIILDPNAQYDNLNPTAKPTAPNTLRTFTMTVIGPERSGMIALGLIRASQWYEFTPLPCDHYEFKVKEENAGLLQQAVTASYEAYPFKPGEGADTDDE